MSDSFVVISDTSEKNEDAQWNSGVRDEILYSFMFDKKTVCFTDSKLFNYLFIY